jgi:hypothetical protein
VSLATKVPSRSTTSGISPADCVATELALFILLAPVLPSSPRSPGSRARDSQDPSARSLRPNARTNTPNLALAANWRQYVTILC